MKWGRAHAEGTEAGIAHVARHAECLPFSSTSAWNTKPPAKTSNEYLRVSQGGRREIAQSRREVTPDGVQRREGWRAPRDREHERNGRSVHSVQVELLVVERRIPEGRRKRTVAAPRHGTDG